MKPNVNFQQCCGLDSSCIDSDSQERPIHRDVVLPFQALKEAAAASGIDLAVASGFRDFERQKLIWNAKAEGTRIVHDDQGDRVSLTALSVPQKIAAIWRYSALPGTSRHHWGTDLDVYDRAVLPEGESPHLLPAEYAPGGPFADLQRWLFERIRNEQSFGFFQPYCVDRGGIAPEPWHLSYAPLSADYEQLLDSSALGALLLERGVALAADLLPDLPAWLARFARVPKETYPRQWRL